MITVFGSINVDYVFQVASIPAPGETLLATDLTLLPGGKGGNQALAAARAGARVNMVGAVGNDGRGDIALAGLLAAKVNTGAVATHDKPTGTATISVDAQGENSIVVYAGANESVSHRQLDAALLSADTILMLQMEIPIAQMTAAIKKARTAGATVVWNLAPMQPIALEALQGVDYLMVNEIELDQLGQGLGLAATNTLHAKVTRLAELTDCSVVVTLGADGSLGVREGVVIALPALPIAPVDTVGAGDAFAGAFAAALNAGQPFEQAMRWGNVAGALACLKTGAQSSLPSRQDIEDHLPKLV